MPFQNGTHKRADSLFARLRKCVHELLDTDAAPDQILSATCEEVHHLLPFLSKQDGESIADFIIEDVAQSRLCRRAERRYPACQVIPFPRAASALKTGARKSK